MMMSAAEATMDDLVSSLALDFSLANNPGMNADTPHPHFALYKNRGRALDQEARRRKELEMQKKKRFDAFMHARRLAEDDWTGYDCPNEEEEEEEGEEERLEMMDAEGGSYALKKTAGRTRSIGGHNEKYYRKQLMLAEWFLSKPPDFEAAYLMKMCPVGKHVLVVAAKGNTRIYNKGGRLLKTFSSNLPGGGQRSRRREISYLTVLDCIYTLDQQLLHVLDVMAWRQNAFYDEPSRHRFDWLSSYYKCELEDSSSGDGFMQIRFSVLPAYSCDKANLENIFAEGTDLHVDGLLFYHGDAHYHFGNTSLVTWLKPYMVSEQLGVRDVHANFLRDIPSDYVNYLTDIQKYEETRRQLRHCIGERSTAPGGGGVSVPGTALAPGGVGSIGSGGGDEAGPCQRQRHNTLDNAQRSSVILTAATTSPVHGRTESWEEGVMMDE